MRFGRTVKVLAKCKLKYYRISECAWDPCSCQQQQTESDSGSTSFLS